MWFHLLSVAAFLALGSCRGSHGHSRSTWPKPCISPDCPCDCSGFFCPPCPIPKPYECLSKCGTPECPCLNPDEGRRSGQHLEDGAERGGFYPSAYVGVSTVVVVPTGPVCSAINIGIRLMLTLSTCVAGIARENLYVVANFEIPEFLKVTKVIAPPYNTLKVGPVLLLTEKTGQGLHSYEVPPRPIDSEMHAGIRKWMVVMEGRRYEPTLIRIKSHKKCDTGDDYICAETYNTTVMGWNDIGTPLVEIPESREENLIAQGLYIGSNLFNETKIIKYMPLFPYAEWLFSKVEKYA